MTDAEELELLELEKQKASSNMDPTQMKRVEMGLGPTPAEPVREYSPMEETMLGSIVAPQTIAQGAAAAPAVLGKVAELAKTYGPALLKYGARVGTAGLLGEAVARRIHKLGGGH